LNLQPEMVLTREERVPERPRQIIVRPLPRSAMAEDAKTVAAITLTANLAMVIGNLGQCRSPQAVSAEQMFEKKLAAEWPTILR
jgi:hypothetical protein